MRLAGRSSAPVLHAVQSGNFSNNNSLQLAGAPGFTLDNCLDNVDIKGNF